MSFAEIVRDHQARIEAVLDHYLPSAEVPPGRLHAAMRYSVLGGGKRVRPLLVYFTGYALDADPERLHPPAAAVELIHAYSLVHDDLPAMDNDDLRRCLPTCHRAFGEATAILAGDGLQALAFEILASASSIPEGTRIRMLETLGRASGIRGMVAGQALDLDAVGTTLDLEHLENMHLHKTGALIRASVRLGALAGDGVTPARLDQLDRFARAIGLAFQVQDDILDIEGATETIGKPQGSDQARGKPTYPQLLGLAGAKRTAAELYDDAVQALGILGPAAENLRQIADYIVRREK